ncbi:hypothetical protein DdX_13918 [Ditylenchus destructor]|uniref:Uncharacterized protein n=1 Tax=Ditylenchus destructor TaxID=166010 RepID=A0AAD4MVA4_9BILA|nr:hypothetical protein DdX_13918 [Ditylenchus destructor]
MQNQRNNRNLQATPLNNLLSKISKKNIEKGISCQTGYMSKHDLVKQCLQNLRQSEEEDVLAYWRRMLDSNTIAKSPSTEKGNIIWGR